MKAVRRTWCKCGYNSKSSDKKPGSCPRCGLSLQVSDQWYASGQHQGKTIFQPCGRLKKDADDYIAACRLAARTGNILPGMEKDISWAEAIKNCEKWWAEDVAQNKIRQRTVDDHYRVQVLNLTKYLYGETLLSISKAKITEMMLDLSKTYAPASVAHAVKALKRIYAMHLSNLDLELEPRPKLMQKAMIINGIKPPEVRNEVIVSASEVVLSDVLAAIDSGSRKKIDSKRLKLAIEIGFAMLLRPINICTLEWSELDLDNLILTIPRSKMKGKRDFIVPIPNQIAEDLKEWRILLGIVSPYVFPAPGKPGQPMKYMGKAISRWIGKLDINSGSTNRQDKITPYVLTRHSGATAIFEQSGENTGLVSIVAHHTDERITKDRYIKSNVEHIRARVIPIQNAMLKKISNR